MPPFKLALLLGAFGVAAVTTLLLLIGPPFRPGAEISAQEPSPPVSTGTYRRPLGNDPETLDPARISDTYGRSVSQQIFDGLVQYDQSLTIKPALAHFWRATRDGLTWTFELRKGVRFHHGRELTADDVVYSFTRILDPRTRSNANEAFLNIKGAREFRDGRAKSVSGLVALDRYTVQVSLVQAHQSFVSVVAIGHAKIVPRDVVEAQGAAFGTQPIGTGPFRFIRWDRGKEIVLGPNADYFDGPPRLSQLVYRIFPGEQHDAMNEEFVKGNLEDAPVPPRADRRALAADPSRIYVKRSMISVRFYGFNTRIKPLDDRRVRQAIVLAINREAIMDGVYFGQNTFARGILPRGMIGYNPQLEGYPYDPQKARELLAAAGYPGGRGMAPVVIWSGARRGDIVREHDLIKKALADVGITAEVKYQTDWNTYVKLLEDGKLPVFLYAWYADVPDPDDFLAKLFHSRGPRNFFRYSNPVVDELLATARNTIDVTQRIDLYRKAEQTILSDAPLIPFFHHTYERLFQPYVRSVEVNGLGDPYIPLRKIWLDRRR
ncbi:MAG TPA: ABC transporter substrate-binding protein [Methylomirabilota bacterium]